MTAIGPQLPSPEWLTVPEACAFLRCSYSHFMHTVRHEMPVQQNRPGGKITVHRNDLYRYAASKTHEPIR